MPSFVDFMLSAAPSWLLQPRGQAWMRAFGLTKDQALLELKAAIKSRFILQAPDDRLTEVGIERQLLRARTDTTESYRQRLWNAWLLWPWAGTAFGVLGALWDQGYTNAQLVIAKGKIFSLDGSRQLVTVNATAGAFLFEPADMWNKFLVYFPSPQIARWVSDGVPADGSDEALEVIALVKKWKSAHAFLDRVVVQATGKTWGIPVTQVWGAATGNWGGTQVTWTVTN